VFYLQAVLQELHSHYSWFILYGDSGFECMLIF